MSNDTSEADEQLLDEEQDSTSEASSPAPEVVEQKKRKANDAETEDDTAPAKRGRGRPPMSEEDRAAKEAAKALKVPSGRGRGRPPLSEADRAKRQEAKNAPNSGLGGARSKGAKPTATHAKTTSRRGRPKAAESPEPAKTEITTTTSPKRGRGRPPKAST